MAYDATVAKRIGELLVEGGVLSQSQLEQALFAQRKDGRKLGQLLVELGLVSEVQVTQTLSRQLSVPWVSLYHVDFSRSLLNLVAREIAEKFCLVPIFVRRVRKQGETLYVAMEDPTNEAAMEEVAKAANLPVKPMIACPSDVRAAIRVYYQGEAAPGPVAVPAAAPSSPASSERESSPGAPAPAPTPAATPIATPPGSRAPGPPPPLPERARANSRVDIPPVEAAPPPAAAAAPPPADAKATPPEEDTPGSAPQIEATERTLPRRRGPRMFSLTLLDGTTISLPTPPKRKGSSPDAAEVKAPAAAGMSDQLTARDLVSALRAVANGVDASEILGTEPSWEAMFSALLSVLLRKGLIADWEFIEEFRKI